MLSPAMTQTSQRAGLRKGGKGEQEQERQRAKHAHVDILRCLNGLAAVGFSRDLFVELGQRVPDLLQVPDRVREGEPRDWWTGLLGS
jgi:hypothetical protein